MKNALTPNPSPNAGRREQQREEQQREIHSAAPSISPLPSLGEGPGVRAEKPDKTTRRIRGTTASIAATAHAMRQELTPAEQVLWQALKGRKLCGLKFRRQHPVGNFILDFYCPACHLIIELDGGVHDAQTEHDAARTAHLNAYGYRVIRFRNEEVMNNLPSVLERIRAAANLPSPSIGRGAGGEGR